MKIINVTLSADGKVEVSAEGYKGSSCTEATKFIEQSLGLDPAKRKKTADYYAQETVKMKQSA